MGQNEELTELSNARRKADLILSYGKQAVRALGQIAPNACKVLIGNLLESLA